MFVRAGLRFENEKNNGISHFLEHMMFRGNRKYPDSISLNLEFEKIGRDLRASTLSEYTYYGFSPHYDQLERGMELFAEFFTDPVFPSIELERGIILEEYLEDLNAEGENVDINNVACALMYKDNALALPTIGTEDSIQAIDAAMPIFNINSMETHMR
ncbi:MAG: insulinase family protein, partial [Nitrospinae bacterium]|nr:insulinase family protein [Nitrospinota bacterium]